MQDFKAFTLRYVGITNVLRSKVKISLPSNAALPNATEINAIWDTGASCTVITKKLSQQLGLIPSGKSKITGIDNHITEENAFLVNLYLPNMVCITFLKIAEVAGISGADILIGMDVIGSGDFSVFTDNEKTVMTYRFPSIGGTDFVELARNISSQRAVLEKIENQKNSRKPISRKEKEKNRKKRKNRKKHWR